MNFQRILLTTDFSEDSNAAFRLAARASKEGGSEVYILHVMTDWEVPGILPYEFSPSEEQLAAQRRNVAASLEDRLRKLSQGWFGGRATPTVVQSSGNVALSICDFAKTAECDLIVMASHGRGTIGTLLLGSVVQRVLKLSPCPILVAPREQTQEADAKPIQSAEACPS
jgi:nucleotide-binding universal stress UspA family protein